MKNDVLDGEILPPTAVTMTPHGVNTIAVRFALPQNVVSVAYSDGQTRIYFVLDNASALQLAAMAEKAVKGVNSNSFAN